MLQLLVPTLLLCIQVISTQPSTPIYITSFVQSPEGVLAPDSSVSFSCQATVTEVAWVVGGVMLTLNEEFTIANSRRNDNSTISTLSTLAKVSRNNTEVRCVAMNSSLAPPNTDSRTTHILVAASPLPPFLQLEIYSNGSGLQAEWDRPFTMSGFSVTSYTLDIVNKTSGGITKIILDQNLSDVLTYSLFGFSIPLSCHNLSFSVIATNSIGDSSVSNTVSNGFPIFPQTDHVILHVDLDTSTVSSALARLTLTFAAPIVCAFQTPATYTVGIFDENGDEISLSEARPAITNTTGSSLVVDVIEARLVRGRSYTAELTIQHQHVPGEAFITFIGIDFSNMQSTTSHNNADSISTPFVITAVLIQTVLTMTL